MAQLKVTQLRGKVGLKRIGDVVVKEDRPEIRGMIATVAHLVTYQEVD
jgi:large subunit ribosomal protein L30